MFSLSCAAHELQRVLGFAPRAIEFDTPALNGRFGKKTFSRTRLIEDNCNWLGSQKT